MEENNLRLCPECGTRITGRVDKKFCSDSCRNTFNNHLNKDQSNLMRNTHNLLRKNYRILSRFPLVDGKTKTTKERLVERGFSFEYHTSMYSTKKGNLYRFVYDLGYLEVDSNFVLIVKKK